LPTETALKSSDIHIVPALSKGKTIVRYTNNAIFDFRGPIWVSCTIVPKDGQAKTFQCSKGQTNYVSVGPNNHWSNGDYVAPHMEYIQSRTTLYIIVLTIVTLVIGVASLFAG